VFIAFAPGAVQFKFAYIIIIIIIISFFLNKNDYSHTHLLNTNKNKTNTGSTPSTITNKEWLPASQAAYENGIEREGAPGKPISMNPMRRKIAPQY
jgi:hypothetical protein